MKFSEAVVWILTLFLLGALGVLIIMHPKNFNIAAGTVFTGFNTWGQTLSGSGYNSKRFK